MARLADSKPADLGSNPSLPAMGMWLDRKGSGP